jgi:prepilin peptidase CpaA
MALALMIYRKRAWTTISNVGKVLRFHARRGPQVHPTINLSNPAAVRLPYGIAIAFGSVYWLCISVYRG